MGSLPSPALTEKVLEFIQSLCSLPGRVAGSGAERQAQELLAGRLRPLGFDTVVEGAVCPPRPPFVLALHAGVAMLGILLVFMRPMLGALLAAFAGLSFWGELRGGPYLLQRALLKRISGNLVARLGPAGQSAAPSDADQRLAPKIIVVAHADVAASSPMFVRWGHRFWDQTEVPEAKEGGERPIPLEPSERRGRRLRLHPGSIVLGASVIQTATALGWAAGLRGPMSLLLLGACLIVQIGLTVVAVDWWRSPPVEGAIDNGSGMGVLLGVAEAVAARPLSNAELWIVATGDREPDADGMGAVLFQFGALLDPQNTFFINVDDVGQGDLHIGTSEGRWDRLPYRPFMAGLAERIARSGRFGSVPLAELIGSTDAGPPTEAGFAAVTLTSLVNGKPSPVQHTPEDRFEFLDPRAVKTALGFTAALVRLTDVEIGGGSLPALDEPDEEVEGGDAPGVLEPARLTGDP
jgi:hypothetical protein